MEYSILSQPAWYLLFFSLGLLSLTKLSLFLLTSIYIYLIRPAKNLTNYGKWAVVTGPTSGIGRSIAFELARKGMNLILVGRNPDKLEQVKYELALEYGSIETKLVIFYLSCNIGNGVIKIREVIRDTEVCLLVNNAGISEPVWTFFHEADIEDWIKIMRVNLESTAQITRAVLSNMIERKKGAVLNIGSSSAIVFPSCPLVTVYDATKCFVALLTQSLHVEYKCHGINVQCQIPLFVATNLTSGVTIPKYYSSFMIDSDKYARAAIRCIGYETISMPNVPHFIQWCTIRLIPDFIMNKLMLLAVLKQRNQMRILKGIQE